MNVNDAVKKNVTDGLISCLIKLGKLNNYTLDCLVPLLYVLCAHHQGHLLSITGSDSFNDPLGLNGRKKLQPVAAVDGEESVLLINLRETVDEAMFEGEAAQIIFNFYERYSDYINEYYQELIETVILYASNNFGRTSGLTVTSNELAALMAALISRQNPMSIFDPCAGLCSYVLSPELRNVKFAGTDLNPTIPFMANVRMDAFGVEGYCYPDNATRDWHDVDVVDINDCDVLASEPPMGVVLPRTETFAEGVATLEDLLISRFMEIETLRRAVILVSAGTCWRTNNRALRKKLCEANFLDTVIELPSGALSHTGVSSTIFILNKDKNCETIKMVLATNCVKGQNNRRPILDVKAVLKLIDNRTSRIVEIHKKELEAHDFKIEPRQYVPDDYNLLPGQELVKMSEVATLIRPCLSEVQDGITVLMPSQMRESICEVTLCEEHRVESIPPSRRYNLITEKCVLFDPVSNHFYIKKDVEPLLVNADYWCYSVDETKVMPEYFAQTVADTVRNVAPHHLASEMQLPLFRNIESQKNILNRMYREESNRLRQKLERLEVLSGKASDLIHNLGVTFSKIGAGVASLKAVIANEQITDIEDNVQFALRQINATGANFAEVKPILTPASLLDILTRYVESWRNFGYSTFDVNDPISELSNDTRVKVDVELFYTLLDCIFVNAHQHGFLKVLAEGNLVEVVVKGVLVDGEQYAAVCISNNGCALPDDFTLKDFVTRGVVGINSAQDGLGGDHICKIAHLFGGFVSIDNADRPSFNVLLPIYITSEDSNFEDYELECI